MWWSACTHYARTCPSPLRAACSIGKSTLVFSRASNSPSAPGLPRYPVRTQRPTLVRVPRTYSTWGLGASRPAPPVRTQRGRLVRVACTYPTEAPGRTCQLRSAPRSGQVHHAASSPSAWLGLAQLGAHMLPPGYLTFAAIAPGTQPTNDGRSGYRAGFANPNPNPDPAPPR